MKKILTFTSLLVALLLFSACSLQPVSSTTNQPDGFQEPDVSVDMPAEEYPDTPADLPAESVFGPGTFSLDLPEGWDVFGPETIQDASGRSYQIYLLAPDQGYLEGPGASKVIVANAVEWTPQDLALNQCSTCLDNGYEDLTLGGLPAQRTEIGGGGVPFTITWYFVEHNGNLIGIAIHDPDTLEPLTNVVESIQFQ